MERSVGILIPAALLAALVLTIPTALADDTGAENGNIEVSFTVRTAGDPDATRQYQMVLSPNVASRLRAGRMIPIATTQFNTSNTVGSNIVPVTSFTYQSVGFSAEFTASGGSDGCIRLEGELENSRVVEEGEHPVIESTSQRLAADLDPGETLIVNRVGGPGDSAVSIEVVANYSN